MIQRMPPPNANNQYCAHPNNEPPPPPSSQLKLSVANKLNFVNNVFAEVAEQANRLYEENGQFKSFISILLHFKHMFLFVKEGGFLREDEMFKKMGLDASLFKEDLKECLNQFNQLMVSNEIVTFIQKKEECYGENKQYFAFVDDDLLPLKKNNADIGTNNVKPLRITNDSNNLNQAGNGTSKNSIDQTNFETNDEDVNQSASTSRKRPLNEFDTNRKRFHPSNVNIQQDGGDNSFDGEPNDMPDDEENVYNAQQYDAEQADFRFTYQVSEEGDEVDATARHQCHWFGCDKVFSGRRYMREHLQSHARISKQYRCKWTGCKTRYTTERKSHINQHVRQCHFGMQTMKEQREKGVTDTFVDAYIEVLDGPANESGSLNVENLDDSNEAELDKFYCRWAGCDIFFTSQSDLKEHLYSHLSPVTVFRCKWIGCFYRSDNIHHMLRHIYTRHFELSCSHVKNPDLRSIVDPLGRNVNDYIKATIEGQQQTAQQLDPLLSMPAQEMATTSGEPPFTLKQE